MLSRNLYILAATLVFFSLVCYVVGFTGITHEPGAPPDGSLWRTIGIVLMVLGLFTALLGVLQGMFEGVENRTPGGQDAVHRGYVRQREREKNQRKPRG
jgi:uncharacterized membrane protein